MLYGLMGNTKPNQMLHTAVSASTISLMKISRIFWFIILIGLLIIALMIFQVVMEDDQQVHKTHLGYPF